MDPVVTLTEEALVVEPGSEVSTVVRIRNTSDVVEEYDLSMLGEAAAYTQIIPEQVSAYVGDVAEATVIFRPPYDSLITSGRIPFAVRAQSREDDDRIEIAEGELTLGAINLIAAKLLPARASGRWRAKTLLELHNRGTEDLVVRMRTLDPDQKLSFALSPREIEVSPDGTAEAFLKIRPRKAKVFGTSAHLPYQVSYRRKAGSRDAFLGATSGGETEAFADGSFEQKPIVATWMMAAFALLLMVGGLFLFRAQTTEIEAVPANPIQAPEPPTDFAIESTIETFTVRWVPPAVPPSGYNIISANPVEYDGGRFDVVAEPDLEDLGPLDSAFELTVEGGTRKCLFIQSFLDDPVSGSRTSSVMIGLASPSGLLTSGRLSSELPSGNCVVAQSADECDAPEITRVEEADDPTTWTVNWTYGEGCDTAGNAVWTVSVNGVPGTPFDDPGLTAANVDLSGEAVNGEYTIRVSPGPGLVDSVVTVAKDQVDEAVQQQQNEDDEANALGRAPSGAYAVVFGHFPGASLPVTEGTPSLAGILDAIFGAITAPEGVGLDVDIRRVYYGPANPATPLPDGMTLVRLPDSLPTFFYLVVDDFLDRGEAVELCNDLEPLLAAIIATNAEAFPVTRRPEGCRAVAAS